MNIVTSQVRCKICDDVISSNYTHDLKKCSCGTIYVDGGREYQRIGWTPKEGLDGVDHYIDTTFSVYKTFSEKSFQIDESLELVNEINEQIKQMKRDGDVLEAIHYEKELKGHLAQIVLLKKEMKQCSAQPIERKN